MNAFAEKFRHLSKLLGNGGHFDLPERFREAADEIDRLEALREELARALEAIAEVDKWDENNPNAVRSIQAMARAALSKHRSGAR